MDDELYLARCCNEFKRDRAPERARAARVGVGDGVAHEAVAQSAALHIGTHQDRVFGRLEIRIEHKTRHAGDGADEVCSASQKCMAGSVIPRDQRDGRLFALWSSGPLSSAYQDKNFPADFPQSRKASGGRPATQRDVFWDYDPSAVMAPELAQQRQAHPDFFTLDYQDYYALHCGTVAAWIARMEQRGTIVRAGAPSHIPALAARGLPGVAPASTPSPAFAREIARAYRRRRLQAIYGAVLEAAWAPEWGKRALRGAVALARTG